MNSFHNALSAFSPGNASAIGNVTGVTLSQTETFGIAVSWGFSPTYDPDTNPDEYAAVCQDTSFGIYLNGRLQQIQPGNIRSANIIAPNADVQEIEVIAWPSMYEMPDTLYAAQGTRRAHLEWDAATATDLAGYIIYHDTTVSPTTEYARQTEVAVDGASFDFDSGASAVISGAPDPTSTTYNNCTFTVTITDATTGTAELTNSVDATTVTFNYVVGQPVTVMNGIVIVIAETPVTDDTLTFPVRILTYYDTAPLAEGTHYFAITSLDTAGNESAPTSDIAVVIAPPPASVTNWDVAYDLSDKLTYSVTQSPDGATINIYSNYDQSTNTLMDEVYYTAPLTTLTVAASATDTGDLLTDMASKPEGDYVFAARAVSAAGVESDDTITDEITMPYTADEPNVVSAEIVQDGDEFTLTWISDGVPSNGTWLIDPNHDGITNKIVSSAPTELTGAFYQYSTTMPVPTDEPTYIFTITAAVYGPPYQITFIFDTIDPDTPGNATGSAY